MKKPNKAITAEQKKKGFLRRKILSLPIWIWIIIAMLGIGKLADNDSSINTTIDVDKILTVAEKVQVESKLENDTSNFADESYRQITDEATGEPTSEPIITATPIITPTPIITETPSTANEDTSESEQLYGREVLQRGSRGEEVVALQKRLIDLGYLSDIADGIFGGNTENALIAYQTAAGLEATGIFDEQTAINIYSDEAPAPTPEPTVNPKSIVLKRGDKGEEVRILQVRLIELGFLSSGADGDFGAKTEAALKAYQSVAGLPVTGECDYNTLQSITSSTAPTAPPTPKPTQKPTQKPTSKPSSSSGSGGSSGSSGSSGSGGSSNSGSSSGSARYIGNKNTKKFHYSWCSSVDQMKEKNKVPISTREEAISRGYVPCKRCDP